MTSNVKQCVSCEEYLPANTEHFYKRADSADGLRGDCKKCKIKSTLANREKRLNSAQE